MATDRPLADVGSRAPEFHLVSHLGEPLTLARFADARGVLLYFMREFT